MKVFTKIFDFDLKYFSNGILNMIIILIYVFKFTFKLQYRLIKYDNFSSLEYQPVINSMISITKVFKKVIKTGVIIIIVIFFLMFVFFI